MNEQLAIYLWSISENIKFSIITAGFVALVLGNIISLTKADVDKSELSYTDKKYETKVEKIQKELIRNVITCTTTGALLLLTAGIIPSKQDLALIFAYPYLKSGAEQVIQSETMNKLVTISNKYLDEVIKERK